MGDMNAPVVGAQADVMKAVVTAGEAAIRKLRPGVNNSEVAKAIGRVAEDFGVRVVEGVLSHNMKRYVIDGNKVILNKPSAELKADDQALTQGHGPRPPAGDSSARGAAATPQLELE